MIGSVAEVAIINTPLEQWKFEVSDIKDPFLFKDGSLEQSLKIFWCNLRLILGVVLLVLLRTGSLGRV